MKRIDSLLLLHKQGRKRMSQMSRTLQDEVANTSSHSSLSLNDSSNGMLPTVGEDEDDFIDDKIQSPNNDLLVDWPEKQSRRQLQDEDEDREGTLISNNRNETPPSKRVRFLKSEDVRYVQSAKDMKVEEIAVFWYTAEERAKFMESNKETVQGMHRSRSENDLNLQGQTRRGLEHLQCSKLLRSLQKKQTDLILAVLELQNEQRAAGSTPIDGNAIAALSQELSLYARNRAIAAAQADAHHRYDGTSRDK